MRKSRILYASLIVSLLLVSSAIFISQTDKLQGKAQTSRIAGTIVLHDSPVAVSSINMVLPGTSCTTTILACGDANPTKLTSYSGGPYNTENAGVYCPNNGPPPPGTYACGSTGTCCSSCDTTTGKQFTFYCTNGHACAGSGCCPLNKYYNPGDGKCYDSKVDYTLKQNRLCGYTYEPLPIIPSNLDFDRDVKYVSVSYSCT